MNNKIRVTVWNEYRHEREDEKIASVYPQGIHKAIADFLKQADFDVKTAILDEVEHGLTKDVLEHTDVLIWWGHIAHEAVDDTIVERVYERVQEGMGLIVLHSGHGSKIFSKLCGTRTGMLKWREVGELERVWVCAQGHSICEGIDDYIEIEQEEMYGEPFQIPDPDKLIFISWFEGGEVFRSGCTYQRGNGKIFYFRPGHEAFPIYYMKEIQRVIINAVRWAAPTYKPKICVGNTPEFIKR